MQILYEDQDLLVVNKPAGMVVNRAESVTEPTVQDWAEERLGGKPERIEEHERMFWERSGVAHRLDKDTSGVLVLGKTVGALAEIMRQFKAREVQKTYVALVHGRVEPKEGWVRVPLKRKGVKERKFGVDPLGKMAETHYQTEAVYTNGEGEGSEVFSLVRLWPKTGRTHQIRVQMAFIKHPLVGDSLYATIKQRESDTALTPRHFLHAREIVIRHPISGKRITVGAELPKDLIDVLQRLVRV